MKITLFLLPLLILSTQATCNQKVDLVVVGDSQTGATWTKSYFGNFIQQCLKGKFVIYGRGGTVISNWLSQGGMDHIETIERTPELEHLNIGSKEKVPECKKRINKMLESHGPNRVLFQFGGNMVLQPDNLILTQTEELMSVVTKAGIKTENCFFLTPTFEMEVATRRNVPHRTLEAVNRVHHLIVEATKGRCQIISGTELMKKSPFFDGKELLKRVHIDDRPGCGGLAANDNVHICGEAARDWANRTCALINP